MLIQFSVENFRSFADEQQLSMVASKQDKTFEESLLDVEHEDFRLLRTAAIYGANASGKSNLLKAMRAMRSIVLYSAVRMSLTDTVDTLTPFRLDPKWRDEPSRFSISVLIEGVRYEYSFAVTSDCVYSESLYVRQPGPKSRLLRKFSREFDPDTKTTSWQFSGLKKAEAELLRGRTRENTLLVSTAAMLNFDLYGVLLHWFRRSFWQFDLTDGLFSVKSFTVETIRHDESLRRKVLRLVEEADLGIRDIAVFDAHHSMKSLADVLPKESARIPVKLLENFSLHPIETTRYDTAGNPVQFSLEKEESFGTQRFFALVGLIIDALDNGSTLVVDELECSMHPSLTRKLIQLFHSPEANPKGAQLIFATHDSSLMDSTLFRRDQIWLTEKRQNGATELFSLYDIKEDSKPRKNEALQRNYLNGVYGGVPHFGPIFEDLEFR